MNTQYNEIIKTYLSQKNTDFAIQIDGPWGCGKTYYVDTELNKVIAGIDSFKVIQLSLNGLSKLEDLNTKILYYHLREEKLLKKKKLRGATETIGDMFLEIAPTFETLNSFVKVTGVFSKLLNKKWNLNSYVLIFDDLERISDDINITDLFGFIFDNFTSKGVKTIFISNELEIKDENYSKRKEKIIRRTISYLPDFPKQLEKFLSTKYTYKKDTLLKCKDFFTTCFKKKGIRNLRTISFIFDNFFEVIDCIADKQLKKDSFKMLFINILLLTDEYKNGRISKEDLKDYKQLNDISLAYFNSAGKENKTYAAEFYSTYNHASGLEYVFIKSIFDFVITGFLDRKLLIKNLNDIYNHPSEQEEAYRKIQYVQELEQDEVIDTINKIKSLMESGKYHLMFLPKLYITFKFIKDKKYIESFTDELSSLFEKAFDKCSENLDNIPDSNSLVFNEFVLTPEIKEDSFYMELIEKIKLKASVKQSTINKNKIEKIFEAANDKNQFVSDYAYGELFSDIVELQMMDKFFELTNYGICYFQVYLRQNILKVSNPWQTDKKSKQALITIKDYLNSNIETKTKNHMNKIRLRDFITMCEDAIQCLTESKEN